MNFAEFTIRNQVLSVIVILLAAVGGWSAYENMPRFEDPEFTIRLAQIITPYPGASPLEVAEEVTEPLERAIQQMQEVESVKSVSTAGKSQITVEIRYESSPTKTDLQIVWTKLRNQVADAQRTLPPGAQPSIVADDFGDVYGLYYFITGEGYSPAELRRYARELQSELLQVDGVAKVALSGEIHEAIFVELSRETAASLGVSIGNIYDILAQQNAIVPAGNIRIGDQRIVIDPTGSIDSIESIQNLLVSASANGRIVYLRDIAQVWRGYQTPPESLMRYNQQLAIGLGVAAVLGSNIVEVGAAIDAKLADAESRRPLGMELHTFYHQSSVVAASVADFVLNVLAALAIVIGTLLVFMGLRSALIIGAILLLTIAATLATMNMVDIPMHRVSLGALIIALGMMVDNAIVVTEGILVGVQKGKAKLAIAMEIVDQTKWPLLGGTLVGCIAFAPIGFAPGSTAEYTGHLFWVVLISLLYSWFFAITLTPLFCYWGFKELGPGSAAGGSNGKAFFRAYKQIVAAALRLRWLTTAVVCALFIASLWGFQYVKTGFFPASATPQMVVDFWMPQGTDIEKTLSEVQQVEEFVAGLAGVQDIQTAIGGGGIRYMLTYSPESANSAFAQLLIRVDDHTLIDGLLPQIQSYFADNHPDAQAKAWRFLLGPGGGSKIEAAFRGPDPAVLRQLAYQAKEIMVADGGAISIKDDWRQQVGVIEPIYSESSGRRAGVSQEDLATALQLNFSGRAVGVFREGDDLIPIVARAPALERAGVDNIQNIQVISSGTGGTVPIAQVTNGFRTVFRDAIMRKEDRIWSIKAQSDPFPDELPSELMARIQPQIEAIPLPAGYTLKWDGEAGASAESNDALASTIPLGFISMVLVVFVLFGKVRQPIVIWLVVPLALIGVVFGLLVTGKALEFMGILGVLSLSGLLIKNAIILVDQTDFEIAEGKNRYSAIIDAATNRVRPVMMGTSTTVLGVLPLFFDSFFQSMAVVLVFGLTFATVLTLIIVPVLYAIFFNVNEEEASNVSA